MGLLDSLKGMLGKQDSGLKDQAMNLADRNNDGQVNMDDFNQIKSAGDINQDGTVNKDDLQEAKNKFSN